MFYNYSHPVIYRIFEIRYAPVYAIVLFAAALLVLVFKKKNALALGEILFAAGVGPLGFSLLRLIFVGVNSDNLVWADFWEELTELMYVSGVALVLWTFRRGLFREKPLEYDGSAAGRVRSK